MNNDLEIIHLDGRIPPGFIEELRKNMKPGKTTLVTNKAMQLQKYISSERRYLYHFKCQKCQQLNKGFMKTAFAGGLQENGFNFNCEFCDTENKIDLEVKYYQTIEVEITKEEFEARLKAVKNRK